MSRLRIERDGEQVVIGQMLPPVFKPMTVGGQGVAEGMGVVELDRLSTEQVVDVIGQLRLAAGIWCETCRHFYQPTRAWCTRHDETGANLVDYPTPDFYCKNWEAKP